MKKRGLLRFLLIIFLIILILILGFLLCYLYINHQANKAVDLGRKQILAMVECANFCPFKNYELMNYSSRKIELIPRLSEDCMYECEKNNYVVPFEKQSEILNKKTLFYEIIQTFYETKSAKMQRDIVSLSHCLGEIAIAQDKTCLPSNITLFRKSSDEDFIIPTYIDRTVKILSLNCTNESIVVNVKIDGASVEGFQFNIFSKGFGKSAKRENVFEVGNHEIVLNKNEILFNPEEVSLSYSLGGENLAVVSEKSC